LYKAKKRSYESFQSVFLKKHSQFKDDFASFDFEDQAEVKKEFFESAYNFLLTAFESIKKKLPPTSSVFMLSDAFLLHDETDIDTIRELGLKFPRIISKE